MGTQDAGHLSILPENFQETYDNLYQQMVDALASEPDALNEFKNLISDGRFYLFQLGIDQQLEKMRGALNLDVVEEMLLGILVNPSTWQRVDEEENDTIYRVLGKQVMSKLNAYKRFRDFVMAWKEFITDNGGARIVGQLAEWRRFDVHV